MVFQSYALYPHMTVLQEPRLRHEGAARAAVGGAPARGGGRTSARHRGAARPPAVRALGRSATARRARTGAAALAAGVPDGRAALEPRCRAARPDARRAEAPARASLGDDRLRHARPGRGDDDGRPDRDHERRPAAAGGHARGDLRPPCQPVRRGLHRLAEDEPRARTRLERGRTRRGRLPRTDCPARRRARGCRRTRRSRRGRGRTPRRGPAPRRAMPPRATRRGCRVSWTSGSRSAPRPTSW